MMYNGTMLGHQPRQDKMLTKLPLIMANGLFKHLCLMNEDSLEKFLRYLVCFTTDKYVLNPEKIPSWWKENVDYPSKFHLGSEALPVTRNKTVKLRRLVKLCYLSYNCQDLIVLSEKLAALHPFSYKFQRNKNDTVTVMYTQCGSPIVTIPASNLDYDLKCHSSSDKNDARRREIQIIQQPLLSNGIRTIDITNSDDDSPCILVDDSDDDVEIITYSPGAFPPSPQKKKLLPRSMRPGPACSKVRPLENIKSSGLIRPQNYVSDQRHVGNKNGIVTILSADKTKADSRRRSRQYLIAKPGVRDTTNPYLKPWNRRTRGQKIVEVDLTVFDDEVEDGPLKPTDLSQKEFLAGSFNLLSRDSAPPSQRHCSTLRPILPSKIKIKNFTIDQVPFLVQCGQLPKSCLASSADQEKTSLFIEKYTRRDTNWKQVVNVRDTQAVKQIVRRCFVKVTRLNSADLRRWKKKR